MIGSNLPNPHPEGCFWFSYAEKWGVPDIKYCEETLCQFISEPANTWSNLAIVFVGIYLHFYYKRSSLKGRKFVELYGLNTVFVGATSLLYHLSNNFLTQFIDFLGMYAFFGLLFLGNLELLGKVKSSKLFSVYLISFLPFSVVFFLFRLTGIPVQLSIGLVILGGVLTKFILLRKRRVNYKFLGVAFAFFVVAISCQLADINRFACDPKNHWIQFHGLWHIFNAFGMAALFFHYERISKSS
ncbi:MAG: ceramidase [Bacteriovoracaceae bacterium]|nr:ceramidase [Bacteriovoracaceae bacterium]